MSPLFKKLNLKDQETIVIINAPESFKKEVSGLGPKKVSQTLTGVAIVEFVILFVTNKQEIETLFSQILPRIHADAVVWFAYPKGSSKKYKCDFNRDTGWDFVKTAGFDTVRQVAIDEDWSALRFRKEEYIKH